MIQPATAELLELAGAVRGDDWREELGLALVAARNAGWSWERTLVTAVRLMVREDASPRDLTAAARKPFERSPGTDPPAEWRAIRERVES